MKDKDDGIPEVKDEELVPDSPGDKRCAPGLRFEDGSCLPLHILISMAVLYNQEFGKDNPIKLSTTCETLNPGKYKRHLVKSFSERLDNICDTQRSWVKQSFMKKMQKAMLEKTEKFVWRPEGPDNSNEWLNTININEVMNQYKNTHPKFFFMGALPLDFVELKMVDPIDKLIARGYRQFGAIINTDPSNKNGTHWFSLWIDVDKGTIYHFDSFGSQPLPELRSYMRGVANHFKNILYKKPIVDYSRAHHQRGGSECGMFSLYFIIRMLEGDTDFYDLIKSDFDDEKMTKMRRIVFS